MIDHMIGLRHDVIRRHSMDFCASEKVKEQDGIVNQRESKRDFRSSGQYIGDKTNQTADERFGIPSYTRLARMFV